MSLHKFAEQVASQGRGDDSLLVHMTPDEVRNLQRFAEANGTTLTINPTTGLPEAGLLSDLFKSIAPIALGAFLGPAGAAIGGGFLTAAQAGLAVGGITSLATGSLSRGLMAGLGAYGGAGIGASMMGAGETAIGAAAEGIQGPIGSPESGFGATQAIAAAPKADVLSAGFNAAKTNPMAFAKQNLGNIGMAAAPIMAMQPTTKMADPKDTGYIRQMAFNINPDTGKPDPLYGIREMAPVKASEWGDKTFQGQRNLFYKQNPNPYELGVGSLNQPPQQPARMNTGGIVALAEGGVSDQQIFDYFAAGPKTDEQIARDMGTFNVTAADIARATGTQDRVSEYENRYTAADTKNDIYDYFADPATQALLGTGAAGDRAIAQTLQDRDWSLANVAAATGTQGQLGDYGTRFVNSILQPGLTTNQFNAYTADVGLTGQNLANALANSGLSASAQYALMHDLNDANINLGALRETDFYKNLGYTKGTAPGDEGGIKGLHDNIKYAASGLQGQMAAGKLTGKEARAAATTEMGRIGVSAADVKAATGKTIAELFPDTVTKLPPLPKPAPFVSVIPGGTYGRPDGTTPGDITTNPDGTVTVHPNIPYRPDGGFSGIGEVRDAWEAGGGSLGYTSPVVKTPAEHAAAYNRMTDDSLDAYNFLMGKGKNLTQRKAETRDRPVMQRYDEAVLGRRIPKLERAATTTTDKKETVAGNTAVVGGVNFDLTDPTKEPPEDNNGRWSWDVVSKRWVQYGKFADGGVIGYAMGGTARDGMQQIYTGTNTVNQAINTATTALGGASGGGGSGFGFDDIFGSGGGGGGGGGGISLLGGGFGGENYTPIGGGKPRPTFSSTNTDYTRVPGTDSGLLGELNMPMIDYSPFTEEGRRKMAEAVERGRAGGVTAGTDPRLVGDYGSSVNTTTTEDMMGGRRGPAVPFNQVMSQFGMGMANGGMTGYAMGGGLGSLGSYSDGGRLLKGPGDGVSDSIPATIGRNRQPARLADGEFVIPARIVSELGNGSTDAGAKKLYAMMDRVQRARGKTTGKNKVAANSRADKHLPA